MKRILFAALCVLLAFTLCACAPAKALLDGVLEADSAAEPAGSTAPDDTSDGDEGGAGSTPDGADGTDANALEANAAQIDSDTLYYNSYLGVCFTLPGGWWLYNLNADNFSENPDATGDEMTMDINRSEGYLFLELIDCANLQFSNKSSHIGLYITAEKEDGIATLDEFIQSNNDFLSEAYGPLQETSSLAVNGVSFGQSTFEIEQDGGENYFVRVFTCKAAEGYFLSFEASYWPENTEAESYIADLLENNLSVG